MLWSKKNRVVSNSAGSIASAMPQPSMRQNGTNHARSLRSGVSGGPPQVSVVLCGGRTLSV